MQITKTFIPFLIVLILLILAVYFIDLRVESLAKEERIIYVGKAMKSEEEALLQFSIMQQDENDSIAKQCLKPYQNYLKEGNWKEAELSLKVCLKDSLLLMKKMGQLNFKAKRYNKASNFYKRYCALDSTNYSVYNSLGIAYSKLRLLEKSALSYRKAIELNSSDPTAYLNLGIVFQKNKKWKDSHQTLQKAIELSKGKEKAKSITYLGIAQHQLGNIDQAKKSFEMAIDLFPSYLFPRLHLSMLHSNSDQQILEIDKVIALAPNFALGYFYKGLIYSSRKEFDNALIYLEKALYLNPDDNELLLQLEKFYIDAEHFEKAKELLSGFEVDEFKQPEYYFNKAKIMMHEGKEDSVSFNYLSAIEAADGVYPEAFLNLGLFYKKIDSLQLAIDYYSLAIRQKPDYEKAFYNRAIAYREYRKKEEAILDYERVIRINSKNSKAWYNLGLLYSSNGLYAKSTDCFAKTIEQDLENYKAHYNLGRSYSRWGKYHLAEKAYKRLINRYPKHANGWYNLGKVLSEQKKYDESKKIYLKCLELQPDNGVAWNNLGVVETKLNQIDAAISHFKEAIELQSGNYESRFNLANQYIKKTEYAKATAQLKKTITLNPKYEKAYDVLINCYEKLGWRGNLKNTLNRKVQYFPEAKNYYELARVYHKEGNLNKALKLYEVVLKKESKNTWGLYWYGKLREEKKEDKKAIALYNRLLTIDSNHKYGNYRMYLLSLKYGEDEQKHKQLLLKKYPTFCSSKNIN